MKDVIPAKKQSPILGLAGMGGGVGSNIVAGLAADPTYVDDVFSTYLYKGTGSDQSINNGIKLGNSNSGSGVEFDGSGDYLTLASTSDVTFGTGDFTIEFWVKKPDSTQGGFFQISGTAGGFSSSSLGNTIAAAWNGSAWQMYGGGVDATGSGSITANAWYHIAVVKSSNTLKMYVNGTSVMSRSDTNNYSHTYLGINGYYSTTYTNKGILSNFRVVKGTAVYTGNFTPPTAELTSITNTKLLCCNNSVMKTATVTPTEIAVHGDPYASGGPFTAIDGEGGMIWSKGRDSSNDFVLLDTERGIDKLMFTNGTWDENAAAANDKANTFRSFDNNGYTIGTTGYLNASGTNYNSWTWRKQKGFFDIVTYTGTGSATTIPHNLGSVPGMIVIKRRSGPDGWRVYHRNARPNTPAETSLRLDTDGTLENGSVYFNDTLPTSSVFSVGTHDTTNMNSTPYVAYLFAGGESTNALARSVDFDGSGDQLNFLTSNIAVGTGNFTCEFWVKLNGATTGNDALLDTRSSTSSDGFQLYLDSNRTLLGWVTGDMFGSSTCTIPIGQWTHIAVVRAASTATKLYVNGIKAGTTYTGTQDFSNSDVHIAADSAYSTETNCKISNFRLTKGQALYTSAFIPPTEPLTTTSQGATSSNVKILACNNSSVTGGTVVSTVQAYGNPTASTDSPFDDPDGFKFGEDEDQNLIKCGSYTGNGDATNGTRVYLGFEPQWVLIKSTGFTEHWHCFDCMRGMVNGGNDARLEINQSNSSEINTVDFLDIHPDGFTAKFVNNVNANNENFVYIAVRRPDGYVGRTPEAGTDVFGLADSIASNDVEYISGFPVDYALARRPGASENWYATGRLNQKSWMYTNLTDTETQAGSTNEQFMFDDSRGWSTSSWGTSYQSWMWKRNAGFDVVNYKGDGSSGRGIPHSLGQVPEMMWVKGRGSDIANWYVYHNAVGNQKALQLETTDRETSAGVGYWNYTDPTSTHFSIGINPNTTNNNYLTILFASVEGISKVGSFAGSSSDVTLNLGFVPRFLMVKGRTGPSGTNWTVWDNIRGITGNYTSGGADTPRIYLNDTSASSTGDNDNVFAVNSGGVKGITIVTGPTWNNNQDYNYIYYAHA